MCFEHVMCGWSCTVQEMHVGLFDYQTLLFGVAFEKSQNPLLSGAAHVS